MTNNQVLVVDDDDNLRRMLEYGLTEKGYAVVAVASAEEALARVTKETDVLITDVKLGGMSGLRLLAEAKARNPLISIIVITAFGRIDDAVRAMQLGAEDYLTKPFDLDALHLLLEKILRHRSVRDENVRLRTELVEQFSFDQIIGVSPKMQEVFAILRKISASDATVLVTGETGTGKELIARALHHNSGRRNHPLVTINCAAIPEALLESELFGHVKGAFTGAIQNKKGKFVLAHRGTIFLDEIGELSGALQAKLLRVLQEREVEPVGATAVTDVDIRVVAATNKDLPRAVRDGTFREDLYYRLAVVPIDVPPLRERREDIPLLVAHFLRKHGKGRDLQISADAMDLLQRYDWPGNVRELENICERMVLFLSGEIVGTADVPLSLRNTALHGAGFSVSLPDDGASLEDVEKAVILDALERNGWNRSKAARFLRVPRHILIYRLQKFGLDKQ